MFFQNLLPISAAFGAMFSWGAADVVSAKVYRLIGSLPAILLSQLIGVIIFALLLPFENHHGNINVLPIIILGIADTAVWWLFGYAMRVGNMAIVGPVFQSSFLTTVILGIIFLHEVVTPGKIFGSLFVFFGLTLLSLKLNSLKRMFSNPQMYTGVLPALAASLGAGAYLFFVAQLTRENGLITTTLILRLSIAATVVLTSIITKQTRLSGLKKFPWTIIFLMALLDQSALATYNLAVIKLDVSLVSIIVSASSLVTVILSSIYLREKLVTVQKAGAVLVVLGLIFLNK